jgi:type III restriction enzyme
MTAFSLETLQGVFAREGESFISEELTAKTRFGEYRVTANLFSAASYSEYLQKLYSKIASRQDFASNRSIKKFPVSQIGGAKVIALLDKYIRERLFNRPFDPAQNNNWKILFANSAVATSHIITPTKTPAQPLPKFATSQKFKNRRRICLSEKVTLHKYN